MHICRGVTDFASVTCLLHAFKECCPGGCPPVSFAVLTFRSLCPWRVELLECGPAQAEVDMMLPLGELSLDMVWCLFVLCLLELRLRSGGDVARLASEERGELPGDASLHDDMPNLTSDALGEDQADLTDILYDPFDRPEGEVIRRAGSSSRSRSPRRA